jgi:Uri superfamily endonuclease
VEPRLDRYGLPAEAGVYVLWLRLARPWRLPVARLGQPLLQPGVYGYVGSARGAGGLAARLGRHIAGSGRSRWHVDHLRRLAAVETAWWALTDSPAAEDACAAALEALPGLVPSAPGFGASDTRRMTHLFFGRFVPRRAAFERLLRGAGYTGPAVRGLDDGQMPGP